MQRLLDLILVGFLCWLIPPWGTAAALVLWLVLSWRTWATEQGGWREAITEWPFVIVTFLLCAVWLVQVFMLRRGA
jgi:hypothetical protein